MLHYWLTIQTEIHPDLFRQLKTSFFNLCALNNLLFHAIYSLEKYSFVERDGKWISLPFSLRAAPVQKESHRWVFFSGFLFGSGL